jgi:hypothetical protein
MAQKDTRFKKGNPGRPKGSKNVITVAYLNAIAADFHKHGKQVIETVRKKQPDVYLKLVAQLVPRDVVLETDIRHYVINAEPELTVEQWREKHRLLPGKSRKLN